MRRLLPFALTVILITAWLIVPPFNTGDSHAAPAAKTVSITVASCAASTSLTVAQTVAKDDILQINFSDTSCNGFEVESRNFTSPAQDVTVSGSTSVTLSQRKQYSALASPKSTLTTITLGAIVVTIENSAVTPTSAFTADDPPNGTVGTNYSYTFAANGGPNFYELASGSLPTGTTLDGNTGTLSGTGGSLVAGTYTFTIQAYNLVTESTFSGASNTVVISPAATAAPNAPNAPTATAGDGQATVDVVGASGGDLATGFIVTAYDGATSAGTCTISSAAGSPPSGTCTVSSLTNGTAYTFKAAGTNSVGTGAQSTASSAVTPKAAQTISYAGASDTALSAGTVGITASASSGLAVSITNDTPSVCTATGTSPNFTISLLTTGTCTTTASQGGNGSFLAATTVTRSFSVTSGGGGGESGGGSSVATPSPSPSSTAKVTLCHRTSSVTNPYVRITVDQSAVLQEGHGSHTGGLFPEPGWGDIIPPFDGYAGLNWPAGQSIWAAGCDTPKDKVTLCHATSSKTNPYVMITVDKNSITKRGHGSHTGGLFPTPKWGDIIPPFDNYPGLNWPGGESILNDGCSIGGSPKTTSVPEQPTGLAQPAPTPTGSEVLKPKDVKIEPGPKKGEIEIVDKDGSPLTLLDVETTDGEVTVINDGADMNKPSVWQQLDYGDVCWKLEPFNGVYLYTLPSPIQLPAGTPAGNWSYSNVIVKAGSVKSSDSTLQPNTVFANPAPGDVVWADVNANGVFDPGGQGKDKEISHIIICASTKAGESRAPSEPPADPSPTTSASPSPTTNTPAASPSPSLTPTPSPTGTATSSPSPTSTSTSSPTPTGTSSPSPTTTLSPTPSPTSSPTSSPSSSPSSSPGSSPSPTPSATPTIASPEPPDPTPPPIVIRILPTPSPTPTTTSGPTASPTASPTTSPTASPTTSPTASPTSTSTPVSSPSPTGTAGPSPSPSVTASPTGSPSPSPTSTDAPGATPSPTTPGSTDPASPTPIAPGGDGSTPPATSETPGSTTEPVLTSRSATVTLTVAKGMSVVEITVPMERMMRIADRGGTLPDSGGAVLADTGSDRANALAATVVVAALALLLIPAGVRRRRP